MDCLFCSIVKKEIPSNIIYEDDYTIAFLDIFPAADGHVLVIPKKHFVELKEMPREEHVNLIETIKKIYHVIEKVTNCDGIHLIENYGIAQEIKHVHFHIIPTYSTNKVININSIGNVENLNEIANKIKKDLN
ncbi:MAG: HIT family protein [Bacilli bacterium]